MGNHRRRWSHSNRADVLPPARLATRWCASCPSPGNCVNSPALAAMSSTSDPRRSIAYVGRALSANACQTRQPWQDPFTSPHRLPITEHHAHLHAPGEERARLSADIAHTTFADEKRRDMLRTWAKEEFQGEAKSLPARSLASAQPQPPD